ncbi:class I SAM-dependent methyltransferase [Brachybacterium hainanense]|uniref:Class I SAM-dependent methyltransferase n=1 Tax=Brachybacterium hainanense TaxID=1541174 RepID=A0ABV6RCY3_9MICO
MDAGCGNGAKISQLAEEGASAAIGVDISAHLPPPCPGVELLQADLSDLAAMPELSGRSFDRILFLQSIGYAPDGAAALRSAKQMLTPDGVIIVTRTQPVRYAVERAEQTRGAERNYVGEEYFSTEAFPYRHAAWDEGVTLMKKPYTMSDLLNMFSAAGLWLEATVEPQLSVEQALRYPQKQAALNRHLGILLFRLRPLPTVTSSDMEPASLRPVRIRRNSPPRRRGPGVSGAPDQLIGSARSTGQAAPSKASAA